MLELLRNLKERWKLRRGQCVNCHKPLRDDAADRYCSDGCAAEWSDLTAY